MSTRLESLDWLRGLMALSIMFYHFGGQHDAAMPLGRLGVYGVSIFFILSGLSMAIAYDRYIEDIRSSIAFLVRRLFRIWPLLWLSVALVAIPTYISGHGVFGQKPYSLEVIALNVTTLFGFIAPTEYINLGAWSIGNEMVYYALTPMIIALYHRTKIIGNLMVLATFGLGLVFAFSLLTASEPLEKQWATYINPLDNLCLYCAGLALYFNFRELSIPKKLQLPVFLFSILSFFAYPISGDQINLVTGVNRVAMASISIFVVFAFYKCVPSLPTFIGEKFEQLGIATYGIYLLHPIVMDFTRSLFFAMGFHVKYAIPLTAVGLTIVLALLTYKHFEAPATSLGKRLTRSRSSRIGKDDSTAPAVVD